MEMPTQHTKITYCITSENCNDYKHRQSSMVFGSQQTSYYAHDTTWCNMRWFKSSQN